MAHEKSSQQTLEALSLLLWKVLGVEEAEAKQNRAFCPKRGKGKPKPEEGALGAAGVRAASGRSGHWRTLARRKGGDGGAVLLYQFGARGMEIIIRGGGFVEAPLLGLGTPVSIWEVHRGKRLSKVTSVVAGRHRAQSRAQSRTPRSLPPCRALGLCGAARTPPGCRRRGHSRLLSALGDPPTQQRTVVQKAAHLPVASRGTLRR